VVTITVTCYSWAPSSCDHLFTCGAIFWPPHMAHSTIANIGCVDGQYCIKSSHPHATA